MWYSLSCVSKAFCSILLLSVSLLPAHGVDFRADVMAVVSKAGCNLGSCHGNATGKGGLKLSLRGQDPDLDWLALAREQGAVAGAECLLYGLVGRQRAPRPEEPLMEGFVLHG